MIFRLGLFEREQNSEQDECIFMQFNSNSRPRYPFEVRKLKKLFLVKISRNLPEKGLTKHFEINFSFTTQYLEVFFGIHIKAQRFQKIFIW